MTYDSNGAMVDCPVSLAARWGSSGVGLYNFQPERWTNAMWGNVYALNGPSGVVTCWAVAELATSTFYGQTVTGGSGTGLQTIAVNSGDFWGGDLQAHESDVVQALTYECSLPEYAFLVGYKAKMCQAPYNPNCNDDAGNDEGVSSSDGTSTFIQESGTSCVAQMDSSQIYRTFSGISNADPNPNENDTVICALTPPADDSSEHPRRVYNTRVYYVGGSNAAGCEQNGTCPSCFIQFNGDKFGHTGGTSATFVADHDDTGTFVREANNFSLLINIPTSLEVKCELPNVSTIIGLTSQMDLTAISAGT